MKLQNIVGINTSWCTALTRNFGKLYVTQRLEKQLVYEERNSPL